MSLYYSVLYGNFSDVPQTGKLTLSVSGNPFFLVSPKDMIEARSEGGGRISSDNRDTQEPAGPISLKICCVPPDSPTMNKRQCSGGEIPPLRYWICSLLLDLGPASIKRV